MELTEEFKEARKATQFGGERANPQSQEMGIKPWSIRNQMRLLATEEIEFDDDGNFDEKIRGRHSRARAIALKILHKAMKGESRATQTAIDNIDGKVPEEFRMKELNEILNGPTEVLEDMILSAAAEIQSQHRDK